MRSFRPFVAAVVGAVALSMIPVGASFAVQGGNDSAPLFHGQPGDCQDSAPGGGGVESGNVTVHRDSNGALSVNMVIRDGAPDTTYRLSVTCVDFFGTLTTNSQGTAAGHFQVPFGVPSTFSIRAFDGIDRFFSRQITAG